jgi:hypothetical protein
LWNGWKAFGRLKELPEIVRRCCVLLVSGEETEDDVDACDVVEDVRCKEDASDEVVDSREFASTRLLTLYRLGQLYRSDGNLSSD